MRLLAIDPGNALSAYVLYDSVAVEVIAKGKIGNDYLLSALNDDAGELGETLATAEVLVVEMAESFGAKVWSQVFETVFWTGRFVQAWGRDFGRVVRREVKMCITGSGRAKDGQIRQCLIERWGGPDVAIGTKARPGPLKGVTADMWQALALAVTYAARDARA